MGCIVYLDIQKDAHIHWSASKYKFDHKKKVFLLSFCHGLTLDLILWLWARTGDVDIEACGYKKGSALKNVETGTPPQGTDDGHGSHLYS